MSGPASDGGSLRNAVPQAASLQSRVGKAVVAPPDARRTFPDEVAEATVPKSAAGCCGFSCRCFFVGRGRGVLAAQRATNLDGYLRKPPVLLVDR